MASHYRGLSNYEAAKSFDEFLNNGIVKKRTPDVFRAKSLIEEAEKRKKFLDNLVSALSISDENANYFIENSYEVIIELLRAKLLIDGFNSSGEGAHEAEVSYMRKISFPENDVRFMNDLRYFRNSIKYYGKGFDKDYVKKVLEFLNMMYPKLKEKVNATTFGKNG